MIMTNDIVAGAVMTQEFFLSAGEVNAEGEMALTLLTAKLIDIATAHANVLGIGNVKLAEIHGGWVLSRLTIELMRTPAVNCRYAIATWVESWNRHFSERSFRIFDPESGEVYGYARSIWLVLDMRNRDNAGLSWLTLPEGMVSGDVCPIERQEKHAVIVAPDAEPGPKQIRATAPVRRHTFRYCDVDYYRHVNTVRYVALLLNQFSLEEHDAMRVRRVELSFLHEALCDEEVEILRGDAPGGSGEYCSSSFYLRRASDTSPILYARVVRAGDRG